MKKTVFAASVIMLLACTALQAQSTIVSNFYLTLVPSITGEGAPPAVFYVNHNYGTNLDYPLRVYYELSGTASNGVDYEYLPGYIDFEVGKSPAAISIVPIDDTLIESNKTVTLTLLPCPADAPYPYFLKNRMGNTATIVDNDPLGNILPKVEWNFPLLDAIYSSPANVGLSARASDLDGYVKYVEFFAGGTKVGAVTNTQSTVPGSSHIFYMVWSNAPPGTYALEAVAYDDRGATGSTLSNRRVSVTVLPVMPAPVLTITATSPNATEAGTPGGFTITRTLPAGASSWWSNNSFRVYFGIGGTARSGVDYRAISPYVTFSPGGSTAFIPILPFEDNLVEGNETVALQLYCPSLDSQPSYIVGAPSNAVVTIADNDTVVQPMQVVVGSIPNSRVYTSPATFNVCVGIVEPEDCLYTVELFEGTNSLGRAQWDPRMYYFVNPLQWYRTRLPAGTYAYTAVASNALGHIGVSVPYVVTVNPEQPPVVTITATDPDASEIPVVPPGIEMPQRYDPGVFTVSRTGDTNGPLRVYYFTGGTAQNGIDYERLSNYVVIPAGALTAQIVVSPIDDFLVEGPETVKVQLRPAVLPYADSTGTMPVIQPAPYMIGSPSNAVVTIADDDIAGTNIPPKVQIVRPMDNSFFRAGANILLVAAAADADGSVSSVEFFAGENSLGFGMSPSGVYSVLRNDQFSLVWSNVQAGDYVLTAKATDNQEASTLSARVRITVVETNVPPVTNTTPVVTIAAVDAVASEGRFDFPTTVIMQSNLLCSSVAGASAGTHWSSLEPAPTPAAYWTNVFVGTNTATFEVRRAGPTNIDLTVYYSLQGTAENGMDYVALPGSVTIRAGCRAAPIVIVPIDDTLVEGNETVILALILPPDSSASPVVPYVIGSAARAGAVITDNDIPLSAVTRLGDGSVHVSLPAVDGSGYRLESSSDLTSWNPCLTETATEADVHYIDLDASGATARFYRLVPEPGLAPED